MEMHEFDPRKAAIAQSLYCDQKNAPLFAPSNGICYRCGRNIYLPTNDSFGAVRGITVDEAGKRLVTGCPHCCFSFVE